MRGNAGVMREQTGRLPHSFHHISLVPPSQTCTKIGAMITRHSIMENCARLQRRGVSNLCPGSLKTEPNVSD
jgi:hypothetical protein